MVESRHRTGVRRSLTRRGASSRTTSCSRSAANAVRLVSQPAERPGDRRRRGRSVGGTTVGAVVLQQGTDAILSLTNEGLSRLMYVTMIATLGVAAVLLGYATWLSRRIRRSGVAAEDALESDACTRALPSDMSGDEVGDLSRSFSNVFGSWVLQRLPAYAGLETLARIAHAAGHRDVVARQPRTRGPR